MIVTKNLYKRIKTKDGVWLKVKWAERYSDGSLLYCTNEGYYPDEEVIGYSNEEGE